MIDRVIHEPGLRQFRFPLYRADLCHPGDRRPVDL